MADRIDTTAGQLPGGALEKRVAPQSGALEARTAAQDPDPNTLAARQGELADLQASDESSFLGKMGSPVNLIKLGLALAGGLSGDKNLQAAGLGMGLGTIGRADTDVQQENADRQKRIDDLTALVDKQQQRLSTMLVQAPGAFTDADGNNIVPPETLQDLLALNVPYDPAHVLANAKEGKNDVAQYGVAETLIRQGIQENNPSLTMEGLAIVNRVGGHGWTAENMQTMAHADASNIMRILSEYHEPASVLAAAVWAGENGASLMSPGAMRLLEAKAVGADTWKIDSIDDQIKVDAYLAMKWFNDEWMNEVVDGVSNRERYRANPDESIKQAFSQNPDAMVKLKKVFPATTHGDEMAKIRVNAMMQAAAAMPELQMYMSGALTGTDLEKANALFGMAQSIDAMGNTAQGIYALDSASNEAVAVGQKYVNTHEEYANVGQGVRNRIGADITSIAHRMAQSDGISNFFTQPFDVRQKYINDAIKYFDSAQTSVEDVQLDQKPKAQPAPEAPPAAPTPAPEAPANTEHQERVRDFIGKE